MFRRRQSQTINTSVMFSGRTADFLDAPTHRFDLVVKRNADISGNLVVGGDLTVGGDLRARSFYATGNYYLDTHVLIPAGTIIMSAITSNRIPGGWLDCAGQSLIREGLYNELFLAIGTTYGTDRIGMGGTGTDNAFKLPNLKGRVVVGYDSTNYATMGAIGGASTHTLTTGEMPSHSHTSNSNANQGLVKFSGNSTGTEFDTTTSGELDLRALTTLSIDASGGSQPHNNMQPYMVLTYLIKY